MKILVADGNIVLLDLVQSFLWDQGHEVDIATNALECVAALEQFAPEVVVLDHDLLWGGSAGVLERLKGLPQMEHVPVILTLPRRRAHDARVVEDSRVVSHIQKPLRLSALLDALQGVGARRPYRFVPVGPI